MWQKETDRVEKKFEPDNEKIIQSMKMSSGTFLRSDS
jgi:hypothetical protein